MRFPVFCAWFLVFIFRGTENWETEFIFNPNTLHPAKNKSFQENDEIPIFRATPIAAIPLIKRSLESVTDFPKFPSTSENYVQPDKPRIKRKFPTFMVLISAAQVFLYYCGGEEVWLTLGYDPYRRHELWRFLSISLVHTSASHLWGNVGFQLILGLLLEIVHHWKRVAVIYVCGVLGGSLAISTFKPRDYCVGASGGVYSLFTPHVATIIVNWDEMDNKGCRLMCLLAYVVFEIVFEVFERWAGKTKSNVNHVGHLGGAMTGFLVAICVLRNFETHPWERKCQKACCCILAVSVLLLTFVNLCFPKLYCKTEWNLNYRKTYIFHVCDEDKSDPEAEVKFLED